MPIVPDSAADSADGHAAVRLALASVGVGLAVMGLKLLAWGLTGSVALLSDALESVVNIAAAGAAAVALRVSAAPPDANHPYGHGKAEYFAAVLEGVLIAVAALVILREAAAALLAPRPVLTSGPALALVLAATGLNALWARHLARRARALRSPALAADARHLFTDVITSLGVLVGVAMAWATGLWWLDPLIAAAVAVNIIASGWAVVRGSVGALMDEAPPPETLARLSRVIVQAAQGAIEAHDIRARIASRHLFVDFHLIVPADMTVAEAHAICDRIETALRAAFPGCAPTIHIEPEHKAKTDADPGAVIVP